MSSDLTVACRIQAHPSRAREHADLLARLDGLDPQLILDPGGPRPSSWRTYRLCLQSIPDDATHVLIVQDDAYPCDDFAAQALAAIEERPDRIVCFFVAGHSNIARLVNLERKKRSRWLEFPQTSYVPLVATCFPAGLAREIVPLSDARKIGPNRADDAVVGAWARSRRLTACATLPSLVEHRDELPSVMRMPHGRGQPHRLAAWFQPTLSGSTIPPERA